MARLTWDEVSAPSFNGNIEGLALSNRMFGQAIEAAKGGLKDFEDRRMGEASNAVMADLLSYTGDPDRLTADLTSGEFQKRQGKNLSRVDAATLSAIQKAPGEFLNFAQDKLKFGEQQKGVVDSDFIRANRPVLNSFYAARTAGNLDEAARIQAANPNVFSKVDLGALDKVYSSSQDVLSGDQRNLITGTEFSNEQADRAAEANATTMYQEGIYSGQGERYFNENRDALIGKYGQQAYNRAIAKFQNGGAGGGSGGLTLPGGTASGSGSGNFDFGAQASPDNAAAITEAAGQLGISAEDLATVISYETGGKFDPDVIGGKNNNHMGLIQFGIPERAKYGVKPGMGFKAQMGAVVNFLKDRGFKPGMGILDLYSTINAGSPGLYDRSDNGGKDNIRTHVARMQAEHGARATAFLKGTASNQARAGAAVDLAITHGMFGDMSVESVLDYAEAWDKRDNVTQVAKALTGKGGTFEGDNADNLAKQIDNFAQKHKINAAVAGRILEDSRDGRESGVAAFFDGALNPFSDGLSSNINWDKAEQRAKLVKDRGAMVKAADTVRNKQGARQAIAQSKSQVDQIMGEYQAAQQQAANTGRQVDHKFFQDRLAAATGTQDAANRAGVPAAMDGEDAPPPAKRGGASQRVTPPVPVSNAHAPAKSSAPGKQSGTQAIARLNETFASWEKQSMGMVKPAVLEQKFKDKFGVTIQQARSDPALALRVVQKHNDRVSGKHLDGINKTLRDAAARSTTGVVSSPVLSKERARLLAEEFDS